MHVSAVVCISCLPVPLCHRLVSAAVRVNMVVALADLCHRWPNVLEPWTAYMYEPLAGMHGQYSTVQALWDRVASSAPGSELGLMRTYHCTGQAPKMHAVRSVQIV
jgi:hypothetical protein